MYGFAGDQVEVRGYIELRTTFTDGLASRSEKIRYLVVNAPSAYSILLGRPTLNRMRVVPSTRHMKVKLPSMEGLIITICSDQKEAKKCYENSLKNKRSVCLVTTTPPPGAEPAQETRRVSDTALEVVAEGDVPLKDIKVRSKNRRSVGGRKKLLGDRQGNRYREGVDRQRKETSASGGMAREGDQRQGV